MTLEEKINDRIGAYYRLLKDASDLPFNYFYRLSPTKDLGEEQDPNNFSTDTNPYLTQKIQQWVWTGEPTSIQLADFSHIREESLLAAIEIDSLIWDSSFAEALTSPSEYVRGFKRWQQVAEKTVHVHRKHLEENS